jgi:hypothetical protein
MNAHDLVTSVLATFELQTELTTNITVFWDVTPRSLIGLYRRFDPHLQDRVNFVPSRGKHLFSPKRR